MNDVAEARADYVFGGRIKYNYPVETCICPAFFRRRFTLTERDTILLAILMQYAQPRISIEEFGLQLGFAVRENRQYGLYKDPAETKILHYLLEELAVYNLIRLGKDCIELSPDGLAEVGRFSRTLMIESYE